MQASVQTTESDRDSLLEALVTITRLHHRPSSAESLSAGLPLENGRLTPPLFVRAAERAGFNASYVERTINQITNLVLPVVLQLKDGRACILLDKTEENATVLFVDEQEHPHEVPLESLDERYQGSCYLVKPTWLNLPPRIRLVEQNPRIGFGALSSGHRDFMVKFLSLHC